MKRWQICWWTADRKITGSMNNLHGWELESAQVRAVERAGPGGGIAWRVQPSNVSEFAGFEVDEAPGVGPGASPAFS